MEAWDTQEKLDCIISFVARTCHTHWKKCVPYVQNATYALNLNQEFSKKELKPSKLSSLGTASA